MRAARVYHISCAGKGQLAACPPEPDRNALAHNTACFPPKPADLSPNSGIISAQMLMRKHGAEHA